MRHRICVKWLFLLTCVYVLGLPIVASANGATTIDRGGRGGGAHIGHHGPEAVERTVGIELTGVGDSSSSVGNASVGTTGVIIETEYEKNYKVYSFNFESWSYDWTNPENLPFVSGTATDPWSNFYTRRGC